MYLGCLSVYSYIKPQPKFILSFGVYWCLSVYSYIKPQLILLLIMPSVWCLSVYSYIKPQLYLHTFVIYPGVYLSIPTSNHNSQARTHLRCRGVYLSIPTSNHNLGCFFPYIAMSYVLFSA